MLNVMHSLCVCNGFLILKLDILSCLVTAHMYTLVPYVFLMGHKWDLRQLKSTHLANPVLAIGATDMKSALEDL